ncbi:MAG: GNAT family N-acetyltransferase [Alphaproteobacteria bacterium]|nr:GNAT family N-acetyltransferase [Alphaproteobacteria bacterium]
MIRRFESEDTEAVVKAWYAASELAHPFLTTAFLKQEAENIRNIYIALAEIWVTEIDGKVVGFIALVENEIGGLFLDPAYHGRGLGHALVDKAVSKKGALTVAVFKENSIGRRFYRLYGFHRLHEFIHEETQQATLWLTFTPSNIARN